MIQALWHNEQTLPFAMISISTFVIVVLLYFTRVVIFERAFRRTKRIVLAVRVIYSVERSTTHLANTRRAHTMHIKFCTHTKLAITLAVKHPLRVISTHFTFLVTHHLAPPLQPLRPPRKCCYIQHSICAGFVKTVPECH